MAKREGNSKQVQNSETISVERNNKAWRVLEEFVFCPENGDLVWRAAKAAHEAAGMTQEAFRNSLCSVTGLHPGNWILQRSHDFSSDPYRQLGLTEWIRYLYYGGCRKQGEDMYAQDQDVVMCYFGIEPQYVLTANGRHLGGLYGRSLFAVISLRNELVFSNPLRLEQLEPAMLLKYYYDLVTCLEPLSQTQWAGQEECQKQFQQLDRDLHSALIGND